MKVLVLCLALVGASLALPVQKQQFNSPAGLLNLLQSASNNIDFDLLKNAVNGQQKARAQFDFNDFDFSNIDYNDILSSFGLDLDKIDFDGILNTLNLDFDNIDLDLALNRLTNGDFNGYLNALGLDFNDLDIGALNDHLNIDFSKFNPQQALDLLDIDLGDLPPFETDSIFDPNNFKDIDFDNLDFSNFDFDAIKDFVNGKQKASVQFANFDDIDYNDILSSFGLDLDKIDFDGILNTLNLDFDNIDLDLALNKLTNGDFNGYLNALGLDFNDLDIGALNDHLNIDFSRFNPQQALDVLNIDKNNLPTFNFPSKVFDRFPFPLARSGGTALIQDEQAKAQILPLALVIILPFLSSAFGVGLSKLIDHFEEKKDDSATKQPLSPTPGTPPFDNLPELVEDILKSLEKQAPAKKAQVQRIPFNLPFPFVPGFARPAIVPGSTRPGPAKSQNILDGLLDELEEWLNDDHHSGNDHHYRNSKAKAQSIEDLISLLESDRK